MPDEASYSIGSFVIHVYWKSLCLGNGMAFNSNLGILFFLNIHEKKDSGFNAKV